MGATHDGRPPNLAVLFPPALQEQVRLIWDLDREVTPLEAPIVDLARSGGRLGIAIGCTGATKEGEGDARMATVAAFLEPVEAVAFAGLLLERLAAITASDPALAKEMSRMIDAIGQGQRRILRALKRAPRVSD